MPATTRCSFCGRAAAPPALSSSMRTRTPGVPRSHGRRAVALDWRRESTSRASGVPACVRRRWWAPDARLPAREHARCVSDSRGGVMSELLDAAGRRRSPATLPEFHAGRRPRNKGMRYPADPPTIEEIVSVMRHAGDGVHGRRRRGLIVVLWRAGLRICEALALAEADLDSRRGSLLVRRGK